MKRKRRIRAYRDEDSSSTVAERILSKAREDEAQTQSPLSAGFISKLDEEQGNEKTGRVIIYIPDNGRDPGMVKTE